jgi:hypothetical protein
LSLGQHQPQVTEDELDKDAASFKAASAHPKEDSSGPVSDPGYLFARGKRSYALLDFDALFSNA